MRRPRKSAQKEQKVIIAGEEQETRRAGMSIALKITRRILLGLLCVLIAAASLVGLGMWTSRYPDRINMGTACNMGNMPNMDMSNRCQTGNASASTGTGTPLASLQAPETASHIDTFTLTAQLAHLSFNPHSGADAWTFNGTSPGPTLRVHQGDLVVVHLINHLLVGVTIHWHGVAVPNSADGVAGVTQDAVKPGQSYTYRFLTKDAGTYWYHSHQESMAETDKGLFGILVVEPAMPITDDQVDVALGLHTWSVITVNGMAATVSLPAQPGQWVRLRLVDTDTSYRLTLAGAPFLVAALDGHDLHKPTLLTATTLAIEGGQRYDLRFRMPESGPVALLVANDTEQQYPKTPAVLIGQGPFTASALPSPSQNWFDFSTYGQPRPDRINAQSHFDATSTISLGFTLGFSNGRPGPVFTLGGQAFPNTPTIMVKPGQLVRLRLVNTTEDVHPMHLHGHTFTVLTKNGRPLAGSPIHLDTIAVRSHETYEIAFYADNPGLWMLHCHNLFHANHGMDLMVVYPNISTPYTIGNASGNFPD
jgi:FtsP/CotA-like multicopper oxidase with cupredoxin domain